jgi:hypothetical protein
MKKYPFIILSQALVFVFLIPVMVFSQGAKPTVKSKTVERSVASFHYLMHKCSAEVFLTQGPEQSIKVEADEPIVNRVRTDVVAGRLVIWTVSNLEKALVMKVYITVPKLDSIQTAGLGKLKGMNKFKGDKLYIQNKFDGDLEMDLDVGSLTVDMSAGGDIQLKGTARSLTLDHHGTGVFNAMNLQSAKATLNMKSTGTARVNVSETLNANISGSGGIQYKGNPATINKKLLGSGTLEAVTK